MAVPDGIDRAELTQLLALLALVAGFYVFIIPAGIPDPDGFRLDEGLPPSFSARLAAGLCALVMLLRLARLLLWRRGLNRADESESAVQTASEQAPTALSMRVWAGVAVSLLFAFVLVPTFGFLPASVLALVATLWMLGERRVWRSILYALMVTAGVWLLFSYLLSVKLPTGRLLPMLTSA